MTEPIKPGDKLHFVSRDGTRERAVVVNRVGRKWIYAADLRIERATGVAEGPHGFRVGVVFRSEKAWEIERERIEAWRMLRSAVSGPMPPVIAASDINAIRATIESYR